MYVLCYIIHSAYYLMYGSAPKKITRNKRNQGLSEWNYPSKFV